MKTFIITDQDSLDNMGVVQSEEKGKDFLDRVKKCAMNYFDLDSIELMNWVGEEEALFIEGMLDEEKVAYVIHISQVALW